MIYTHWSTYCTQLLHFSFLVLYWHMIFSLFPVRTSATSPSPWLSTCAGPRGTWSNPSSRSCRSSSPATSTPHTSSSRTSSGRSRWPASAVKSTSLRWVGLVEGIVDHGSIRTFFSDESHRFGLAAQSDRPISTDPRPRRRAPLWPRHVDWAQMRECIRVFDVRRKEQ